MEKQEVGFRRRPPEQHTNGAAKSGEGLWLAAVRVFGHFSLTGRPRCAAYFLIKSLTLEARKLELLRISQGTTRSSWRPLYELFWLGSSDQRWLHAFLLNLGAIPLHSHPLGAVSLCPYPYTSSTHLLERRCQTPALPQRRGLVITAACGGS